MKTLQLLITLAIAMPLGSFAPAMAASPAAVQVTTIAYSAEQEVLEFTVQNNSDIPVVAWKVEWRATDAFGNTKILSRTFDRIFGPKQPIGPNESWSHTERVRLGGNPALHTVDVNLACAIFADNRVFGDSRSAGEMFELRRAQHGAFQAIQQVLETSGSKEQALFELSSLYQGFRETVAPLSSSLRNRR